MGSEMRHTQIQASGDQGVSFEEVFELNFEDMVYPRQMRVGKAFPVASKIWRNNGAFRKSRTVVQVKGITEKAGEVAETSLCPECHNLDSILQKMLVTKGF